MVPPACVALEGSCLHWLFPASRGMRESSDFSSDPVQLPMFSSLFIFPQDQPLMIPLHCLSGECAICEEVDFSLFALLVHGLVLWGHSPKQWVCTGGSVTISQWTLMHCLTFILHPPTALPYSLFFHILQQHPTVPLLQYLAWWI